MNIYNFVFCYFYKFWEKRGNDGRIVGSAHVLFTLIIHFLFLAEIILRTIGINIFSLPNNGQYVSNKMVYFIICIPLWIIIGIHFNKNRTNHLILVYNKTYTNPYRNRLKAITITVLPMVLLILLAVLRQQSIL